MRTCETRNENVVSGWLAVTILALAVLGCSAIKGDNSTASNGRSANVTNGSKSDNTTPSQVIDAGALLQQLKRDRSGTQNTLTGKAITVRGFAFVGPTMPMSDTGTGLLGLQEKGDMSAEIQCKFSKADSEKFAKITGDQYVTVTGVFGIDLFPELTDCELVKVE